MQAGEGERRRDVLVCERAAQQVAACFVESKSAHRDPLVVAAYAQLERQTDQLLREVMSNWRPHELRVMTTNLSNPYETDRELIDAVRSTGTLEIPPVELERRHPLLDSRRGGAYDRFRALHDLVGHVVPRLGFDRDGEFAAWRLQHRRHRGLARWALATELHAQHSVRCTTRDLADLKATLIEPRLLRRSAAGVRPGPTTGDRDHVR
jgi:hypothetical protein